MERGKTSLGVKQRNCPNSQGDEIIVVAVTISTMRERSKTQEKQNMHSTVAQYPLTDIQSVPFTGKRSSHTAQVAEGENRDSEDEELPFAEHQVQEHRTNLKVHKSIKLTQKSNKKQIHFNFCFARSLQHHPSLTFLPYTSHRKSCLLVLVQSW